MEYTEKFVYFNVVNYVRSSYRLELRIGLYKKDVLKGKSRLTMAVPQVLCFAKPVLKLSGKNYN